MKRFFIVFLFLGLMGVSGVSFAQGAPLAVNVGTIKNQISLLVQQIDKINLGAAWPQESGQDRELQACTVEVPPSTTAYLYPQYPFWGWWDGSRSIWFARNFLDIHVDHANLTKMDSLRPEKFSITILGTPMPIFFDTKAEHWKKTIEGSFDTPGTSSNEAHLKNNPAVISVLTHYCGRYNFYRPQFVAVGNYLEGLGQGLKGTYKPSDSTWKWILHIGWKDVGGTKEVLGDLKTALDGSGAVHDAFIGPDGSAKPTMQRLSKLLDDLKINLNSIETWKGKAREGINFENDGKGAENTKNTANNTNQITAALKNILRNPSEVDRYLGIAEQNMQQLTQSVQQLSQLILSITPGSVEVSIEKQPIAVMPVGIFGNDASPEGYKKVGPDTIAERLRVFIQDQLAPPLFVLMVVLGGIVYLFVPFNQANINKGKDYVRFAILGYLIILVASAILTLTRGFFGNP